MTEDEAKTKWCPHTRLASNSSEGARYLGNATVTVQMNPTVERVVAHTAKCIGSACMAWRWEWVHDGTFDTTLSGPTLEIAQRVPNFKPSTEGFCGLAGRPA